MNWLGFSLSSQEEDDAPQQLVADQETLASRLSFNSSSGTGAAGSECFDLPPSNFGLLEAAAFNRNNHQDWNTKASDDRRILSSSEELSTMLLGNCSSSNTTSSYCSINISSAANHMHHQPKLENLLGRHSSSSSAHDYMFDMNNGPPRPPLLVSCSTNSDTPMNTNTTTASNNNNNIGLSMIKTWLRNQPSNSNSHHHHNQVEQENSRNQPQTRSSSSLSLSIGTGAGGGGGGGGGGAAAATCSSSDNNSNQLSPAAGTVTAATTTLITTGDATVEAALPRKAIDTFGQRTSIYRGVTRHRWTGRYEAHLWDNSCRREGQTRKGRQVYLGGYDKEDKAARAYDLAALKYWGTTTTTNFPISSYEKEINEMKPMTRQEYVASLRRKSSGFSRGASIYRGVTRHHQHGRWQARIGRVAGNKDLYLGTFSTQEEAAEAYDIAAIKFRGINAVTNFDMSRYDVKSILESSTLPITTGATAKRLKDAQQPPPPADHRQLMLSSEHDDLMRNMYPACGSNYGAQPGCGWSTLAFNQVQAPAQAAAAAHQAPFAATHAQLHYSPYGYAEKVWCKQEQLDTNSTHHPPDQQVQLGSTHNFFSEHEPSSGLMHGIMDSSAAANSIEHSSDSNSVVIYNSAGYDHHHGNNSNAGYMMPLMAMSSRVVANAFGESGGNEEANNIIKEQQLLYDHHQNMFLGSSCSSTDPAYDQHHGSNRNVSYYHLPVKDQDQDEQHESSSSVAAVAVATGTSTTTTTCSMMNWVPTAVPTLANPTFTVWNVDT